MQRNNGGCAFPRPASVSTGTDSLSVGDFAICAEDGMTLRDYFAAKAMQVFAGTLTHSTNYDWESEVCRRSYKLADAMVKESNNFMEENHAGS